MENIAPADGQVKALAEGQVKEGPWKRSAAISLVCATIFYVFIRPILNFLWLFLLSNFKSLVDRACAQAAFGYTDFYNFWSSATYTGLFFAVSIGVAVVLISRRKSERAFSARTLKALWVLWSAALIGSVLTGTLRLTIDFVVMQLKASFYQRLTVLAPRISDQQYKEYLASWAAMRNEEDYSHIVESMEADAKKNGITLPELLSGARVSH